MATKRKKKKDAAAPKATQPRKRKRAPKRKAARRPATKRSAPKRRGKPLQLVLRVEDVPINSPALSRLSDGQRVDLAAMTPRKTFAERPAWATDEAAWRKAIRIVSPHWNRLRHPWPTVAWVYLRLDGPVGHGRGIAERERERPQPRASKRGAGGARSSVHESTQSQYGDPELDDVQPVRVQRLRVDETGIDEFGNYRGNGMWWRVWNASVDSIVRAATASAARAIVTGRAH